MPDWAIQQFSQFPIIVILGVGVVFAARYLDKKNSEYLDRLEKADAANREVLGKATAAFDTAIAQNDLRHQATVELLQKAHDAHVRSMRAESRRLEELLQQFLGRKEDK